MALSRASWLRDLVVGGGQVVGTLLAAPLLRGFYNRRGATPEERQRTMPGDELVPHAKLGYTRAITIDAPPRVVWPWLAQIGQGRGGFYSFDALENLVGCDIHSADRLIPEHAKLHVGDIIRSNPSDYPSWRVAEVEPPHHLVLVGSDPGTLDTPAVRDPEHRRRRRLSASPSSAMDHPCSIRCDDPRCIFSNRSDS